MEDRGKPLDQHRRRRRMVVAEVEVGVGKAMEGRGEEEWVKEEGATRKKQE